MDLLAIREEIKLKLTGYVLELELDDATIDRIIQSALREIQRYICSTMLITIPYKKCIDLSNPENTNGHQLKVSSVSRVFRSEGMVSQDEAVTDPITVSQWQILSGFGNLNYFQSAVDNYLAWSSLQQTRQITSTDMIFRFDRTTQELYINAASGLPRTVTVEYIPRYDDVNDITSDYWIDNLIQMAVALTKITIGRVRSRYTQSNALWTQDGDKILQEGLDEYKSLQEYLRTNNQLVFPID